MLTLDVVQNSVGDYSLILTEYEACGDGPILTQPFLDEREVETEFGKLERLLARAKAAALKKVAGRQAARHALAP